MAARQRTFTLGSKSRGYNRYRKYILQKSDFQVKKILGECTILGIRAGQKIPRPIAPL
jgi:hypothetical protein